MHRPPQVRALAGEEQHIVGTWEVGSRLLRSLRRGLTTLAHSVAFIPGLSLRLRHTICNTPRFADVDAYLATQFVASESPIVGTPTARPCDNDRVYDVHHLVEFIRASQHLRQLSKCELASAAILKASFPELYEFMRVEKSKWPSRTYLVKARALFDMTMMLMMRHGFATHRAKHASGELMNLYMFVDGSPSSGFEALPIIEQIIGDDFRGVAHKVGFYVVGGIVIGKYGTP